MSATTPAQRLAGNDGEGRGHASFSILKLAGHNGSTDRQVFNHRCSIPIVRQNALPADHS